MTHPNPRITPIEEARGMVVTASFPPPPSLILHANGVLEINGSGDDAIDVLSKALCALVRGGYQNQERT